MRISEMLTAIASWLESPNNEALLLAEYDQPCMNLVAQSCVQAANILKQASTEVELMEPETPSLLTPESLDSIADIASAFDDSNDPALKRQASVLDELLLTLCASPNAVQEKRAENQRVIDQLRQKYQDTKTKSDEQRKIPEVKKAIDASNMTKTYKIMEAPLSARGCPDHPGVQISRVGEHQWQCEMDKKVYDFENGFTLMNGDKVPGSDVANQGHNEHHNYQAMFDTRESKLGNAS